MLIGQYIMRSPTKGLACRLGFPQLKIASMGQNLSLTKIRRATPIGETSRVLKTGPEY
jgi:hypothetical protein